LEPSEIIAIIFIALITLIAVFGARAIFRGK